uniref:Syntaxin-71 n=1 Tax=Aegilops tauschii TaxID=37682 RepID=R7W0Z6_AEGTA
MSMIDVLTRVDAICKNYERYDADKHRNDAADPFSRLYADMDAVIDEAIEKSERAARETNRAAAVTLNAGVRRTKARLLEEVAKLQKLAGKNAPHHGRGAAHQGAALGGSGQAPEASRQEDHPDEFRIQIRMHERLNMHAQMKGVSREEMALRPDLVSALHQRIQSIPDGGGAADQNGGGNARPGIKFDSSGFLFSFICKDEGLDLISEGLNTLKNLAEDIGEELDRQVPIMDEIDRKVDKANTELRKTNVRLKEIVNQIRSTRNFTVDIILICIILGIGAYLYNVLAQ